MIAIIDYNAGNLTSVARAVAHLGVECAVTHDADRIRRAERIIFPGVGAAGAAMESLRRMGLDRVLVDQAAAGKPVLGICLGCQVILGHSEENDTACLGLVAGRARAFSASMTGADGRPLKIPHMGWNRIHPRRQHPLFAGIGPRDEFYFVHGFFPQPERAADVLAVTEYGVEFASVIGYRNLVATQFHLEKSGRPGLRMLHNFCRGPWVETTC
ncbi:MAG: imidazole glycerol phosphate synthase subunit HisH [Desulfobacterales bacterium]|jgi:glutamine amidotransferase|nr:imidazole glycerol phosphate synthase subunit HisH [Desulfobacterales bacterium]